MTWMAVETAPIGKAVLVSGTPYKNKGVLISIGILYGDDWQKADDMFGWFEFDCSDADSMDELDNVTHWMPLPEPPE